jgi:hypothetical protein
MFNCSYNHYLVQQHLYADFLLRKYDLRVSRMLLVQCHPQLGGEDDYNEAELMEQKGLARSVLAAFADGWSRLLETRA